MLPIVERSGRPRAAIARSGDRRIAFGGLLLSALWLGSAAASLALPAALRLGAWLPLHMVLAGAATTAIAAILPFFTAALVSAPPAHPAIRIGGIGLVSAGAVTVMTVFSRLPAETILGAVGGASFMAGLGLVAVAAFVPLRGAFGQRRPLVERAYALALANVAVGATLATLLIAGNATVATAWGNLKPAHAWLNLIGFVGLVIVATLLHLAPTVLGTRIRPLPAGPLAVVGVGAGTPLVAAGFALQLDLLVRLGALVVVAGAVGVGWHGVAVRRDAGRGRWTGDRGWHALTGGSILAGHLWLGAGFAVAAGRVLIYGADPAGWSVALLLGPLLIGGIVQVLVGAISHLVPAIGPGDPVRHGARRLILGRIGVIRLLTLNVGAVLVSVGLGPAAGLVDERVGPALVQLGLVAATVAVVADLLLVVAAVRDSGPR